MARRKTSRILRAIRREVKKEKKLHFKIRITPGCSELNCSTYCSDHEDADH